MDCTRGGGDGGDGEVWQLIVYLAGMHDSGIATDL